MSRWRAALGPLTVALLTAAGCGDGRPAASGPRITVTTAPLRTLPPDAAPDSSGPLRTLPPEGAAPAPTTAATPAARGGPFCDLVRRYNEQVSRIGSTPREQLPQLVREVSATVEQAAGMAPHPVRADMGVLASTHRRFLTALEQVNFDVSRADPAAIQALRSEPFVGARERVRAHNRTACG